LPVFFGFGRPAFRIAMAIACFCGLPALTSVAMFFETVSSLLPDLRGMFFLSSKGATMSRTNDPPDFRITIHAGGSTKRTLRDGIVDRPTRRQVVEWLRQAADAVENEYADAIVSVCPPLR
jgi:hypothetical protein